jgi:hypothetical protein
MTAAVRPAKPASERVYGARRSGATTLLRRREGHYDRRVHEHAANSAQTIGDLNTLRGIDLPPGPPSG